MRGSKVKQIRRIMTAGLGRAPSKSEMRATKKAVLRIRRHGA